MEDSRKDRASHSALPHQRWQGPCQGWSGAEPLAFERSLSPMTTPPNPTALACRHRGVHYDGKSRRWRTFSGRSWWSVRPGDLRAQACGPVAGAKIRRSQGGNERGAEQRCHSQWGALRGSSPARRGRPARGTSRAEGKAFPTKAERQRAHKLTELTKI